VRPERPACLSTLGCAELTFAEQCTLATRWGIRLLELRSAGGSFDLPAVEASDRLAGRPWRDQLDAQGMEVACVNTSWRCDRPPAMDEIAGWAALADRLRTPWLRVFPGDGDQERAAAGLAGLDRTLAAMGAACRLALETHDGCVTSAATLRLLTGAPHGRVGIVWDSHHTWRGGGEDPLTTWNALGHAVVLVQVKDSVDRPSQRHPYTYVIPGHGQCPLADISALLARESFRGPVSLEWERHWHPYLPPLDTALAACRDQPWMGWSPRPPSLQETHP
jgi:sugar phosphate isomerase/epimerase